VTKKLRLALLAFMTMRRTSPTAASQAAAGAKALVLPITRVRRRGVRSTARGR